MKFLKKFKLNVIILAFIGYFANTYSVTYQFDNSASRDTFRLLFYKMPGGWSEYDIKERKISCITINRPVRTITLLKSNGEEFKPKLIKTFKPLNINSHKIISIGYDLSGKPAVLNVETSGQPCTQGTSKGHQLYPN